MWVEKRPKKTMKRHEHQKIYVSMARISTNAEITGRYFWDILQLTDWTLDLDQLIIYHRSYCISYWVHFLRQTNTLNLRMGIFTVKWKGEVCKKMCDDKGKLFTAALYNILIAPGSCNCIFSIIVLMNSGYVYLSHGCFCVVFFSSNQQNAVKLSYSSHRKYAFLVFKSKFKTTMTKKRISLGLLHHRLVYWSKIYVLAGDNSCVWQDI